MKECHEFSSGRGNIDAIELNGENRVHDYRCGMITDVAWSRQGHTERNHIGTMLKNRLHQRFTGIFLEWWKYKSSFLMLFWIFQFHVTFFFKINLFFFFFFSTVKYLFQSFSTYSYGVFIYYSFFIEVWQ